MGEMQFPGSKENTMPNDRPTTIPEFNPSGSEVVSEIKRMTEELMAYIQANVPDNRQRLRALDNLEDAAMLAVKANFV
jgi:hypothetical protein